MNLCRRLETFAGVNGWRVGASVAPGRDRENGCVHGREYKEVLRNND